MNEGKLGSRSQPIRRAKKSNKIFGFFPQGPLASIRLHFRNFCLYFILKKMEVVEAVEASNQIATGSPAQHRVVGLNPVIASTASMPPFFVDFNGLRPNKPPLPSLPKPHIEVAANRYSSCRLGLDVHSLRSFGHSQPPWRCSHSRRRSTSRGNSQPFPSLMRQGLRPSCLKRAWPK
jgi:hypothetical protein